MSREDEIYCASENSEMPFTTEVARQVLREAWRQGAQWADEHQPSPWISAEEQPKKTDVYYVRTRQGCADMAYFDSSIEKWEKGRFTDGTVTHWMPIPKTN